MATAASASASGSWSGPAVGSGLLSRHRRRCSGGVSAAFLAQPTSASASTTGTSDRASRTNGRSRCMSTSSGAGAGPRESSSSLRGSRPVENDHAGDIASLPPVSSRLGGRSSKSVMYNAYALADSTRTAGGGHPWRPARVLVARSADDEAGPATDCPAHVDVETAARAGHEGDAIPSWRPCGRVGVAHVVRQTAYVTTIAVHHVNLGRSAAVGRERDLPPRGRPRG